MNNQLLESIRYLVMGVLTTLVNYVIYHALDLLLQKQSISPFFSLRVFSGIASFFLLVFFVDILHFSHGLGWLASSVINLVGNYFASKFLIFK